MLGEPIALQQEADPIEHPPEVVKLKYGEEFDLLGIAREILENSAFDDNPTSELEVVETLTGAFVKEEENFFGTETYEIHGDTLGNDGVWGVSIGNSVVPLKDIQYMAKVYQIPEGITMEEIPSFRIEASNKVLLKETLPAALTILVVGTIVLSLISTISKKRKESKKQAADKLLKAQGQELLASTSIDDAVVDEVVEIVKKPKKKKKKTKGEITEEQIEALPPKERREFERLVIEQRMAPAFAVFKGLRRTRRRLESLSRPKGMSQADWELHVMATLSGFHDTE